MRNLKSIQERYLRDDLSVRLGGLAANLARIKSFSGHAGAKEIVRTILKESKFFVEWTAPQAGLEVQIELIELQRQLVQWEWDWEHIWADPIKRDAMRDEMGRWSQRVLDISGLLPKLASSVVPTAEG
jgi:hypothetical protein